MSKLRAKDPTLTKFLALSQGFESLVDASDFDYLSQYSWHYSHGYAKSRIKTSEGWKYFYLHRFLLNAAKGVQIDHINGDSLDNRKCNLRICNNQQNSMNTGLSKNNTSGFKGVSLERKTNKWWAKLMYNRKVVHIGFYHNKEDAAREYDKAAIEFFGEFALTNESLGLFNKTGESHE